MASLPSRKATKISKKKSQKHNKLTKPRPKKRDTSTGRQPHETTTLARGTWHSWPSPSDAIRTYGVRLQKAPELRNRKSVHFADVDSTSSYPQWIQPPTASGSHSPGPSNTSHSQRTYNPSSDHAIVEVPRNISNATQEDDSSPRPILASHVVHLEKPHSSFDPPMVKTHRGLRFFTSWTVPTSWSMKTSLNLGYSISVETCFTILRACPQLQEVTLMIGSKKGSYRSHRQLEHHLCSLSITASVDPVFLLSYLKLRCMEKFSLTWDTQHKLPHPKQIGLLPLISRSTCFLQSLSLVNVCPNDKEISRCLELPWVRYTIQEVIVRADPDLLPRHDIGRFVSSETLGALSRCPSVWNLQLSHCNTPDHELANMVDRLLLRPGGPTLRLSSSCLMDPGHHEGDRQRLLDRASDSKFVWTTIDY
ncbi:hypothetical protein Hypma_001725 [Hypsizygus marmoreus]|uniref:F-box domain-containing protein n=1 Tax=Hypsizygus marmoreus TaxID=39966 RepID=A0A369JCX0_HYPMA|nr:hypothetical protein Hypma_001725 [Hypsizygus marmoreus]